MNFTTSIAKAYSLSPFDILKQDTDNVLLLINYYIEKSDTEPDTVPKSTNKETRKLVDSSTATGGWF